MKPSELWDIFEEAYLSCAGTQTKDDDQIECGEEYGKMKRSIESVIGYWLDPNTTGGHVLVDSGYTAELPDDLLENVRQYEKEVEQAKRSIARKYFS